jgi:hypothetical protein
MGSHQMFKNQSFDNNNDGRFKTCLELYMIHFLFCTVKEVTCKRANI